MLDVEEANAVKIDGEVALKHEVYVTGLQDDSLIVDATTKYEDVCNENDRNSSLE